MRTRTYLLLAALLVLTVSTVLPLVVRAESYSVSFVVMGLPSGVDTSYYIDGVLNGTIRIGETRALNFTPGPVHRLSVDLTVNGGNATRYQCRENLWSFSEAGTHTFTFTYKTQYYFEVLSPYGSPSGSDWYDEGTSTNGRIVKNMTEGAEGVRYIFTKWQGDASGQNLISDPMVMDHPKKAVAAWKTQYTLRVSSDPPDISSPSALWVDEGSIANFTASNATALPDTRYVFSEWIGDYTGSNPLGSLRMDGPKLVTAKYQAQYLLNITFVPPEVAQEQGMPKTNWYDAGQVIDLGPVPPFKDISSAERLAFDSWWVDGMTQQGPTMNVSMNGPHQVKVNYRTQYYLTVTSTLGETTGSGWYFSGDKARFSVAYRASDFPVKYSLADWHSSPSTQITRVSTTEAEITMDRPYVVDAVWGADYTPAWFFIFAIVSVVLAVAGVAVVVAKKRASVGRLLSSFGRGVRERKVRPPSEPATTAGSLVLCDKCGAMVPSSAGYCQSCGAPLATRGPEESVGFDALDERVFNYIAKHHGEISYNRASKDLGLSLDDLKNSTERLKKKARLA